MKIGIDIHGVLDSHPFFKEMARLFVAGGHEVHIITGAQFNDRVKAKFKKLGMEKGVNYTHYFSIAEHLIANGINVDWEDSENPWFDEKSWNTAKADYCRTQGIDMHFDDTSVYAQYFTTPIYMKKQ